MSVFQAIILGLVQSLTEFLPVSSSGHMVFAQSLMGVNAEGVVWEVCLHLGTVAAVLLVFGKDVAVIINGWLRGCIAARKSGWRAVWEANEQFRMGWFLIVGSIPAALAGLTIRQHIETLFASPILTASLLFVTGELLWLTRPHNLNLRHRHVNFADSIWIGIAQAAALLPGISRSGSTISTALLREVDRTRAVRFSFLLAIPAILGAGLLEARHMAQIPSSERVPLTVGFITSVIVGYLALCLLIRVVSAGKLHYFAWYCWAASVAGVVYFWNVELAAR